MKFFKTKFRKTTMYLGLLIMLSGFLMVSCDTVSNDKPIVDPPSQSGLTLQFQAVTSPAGSMTAAYQVGDSLVVEGENGTLIINNLAFIVDNFEIELEGEECENEEGESVEGCKELEFNLFL